MLGGDELAARLTRLEANQQAFAVTLEAVLDRHDVLGEQMRKVLDAVTREPGPSPVAELLRAVLAALTEQSALLRAMAPPEDDATL